MNKNWIKETSEMLKKVNQETEKLMKLNLPDEEFHKRHAEIMKFWDEEERRLREKYPFSQKPHARPKKNHTTRHLTEKYEVEKLFRKFNNNI